MTAGTAGFGPAMMRCVRAGRNVRVVAAILVGTGTLNAAGQDVSQDRIDQLTDLVIGGNPDLVAARAAVDFAGARYQASGFGLPTALSGELEEAPGFDLGSAKYRLGLQRELLTGDRSGARRALAEVAQDQALVSLSWLERAVAARVAREISRAMGWAAIARRIESEDSLLSMAEASLRDRLAVGAGRYIDVLRVGTERLRIRSDLAEATAGVTVASASLLALAGEEDRAVVAELLSSLTVAGVEPPVTPAVAHVDSIVDHTLNVRMSGVNITRARAERRLTAAEGRPSVSAGIAAELIERDDGRAFGPAIGLSLSLPFTAGRSNRLALAAADAGVVAAERAHEATVSRVRGELNTALIRYQAARERLAIFNESMMQAVVLERETALDAYQNGELSLVELLDFERAATRVATERLHASMAAADAYADLWTANHRDGGLSDGI